MAQGSEDDGHDVAHGEYTLWVMGCRWARDPVGTILALFARAKFTKLNGPPPRGCTFSAQLAWSSLQAEEVLPGWLLPLTSDRRVGR
jgi:hypothetical protein